VDVISGIEVQAQSAEDAESIAIETIRESGEVTTSGLRVSKELDDCICPHKHDKRDRRRPELVLEVTTCIAMLVVFLSLIRLCGPMAP
jgi:hypothetical protein